MKSLSQINSLGTLLNLKKLKLNVEEANVRKQIQVLDDQKSELNSQYEEIDSIADSQSIEELKVKSEALEYLIGQSSENNRERAEVNKELNDIKKETVKLKQLEEYV